MATVEKLLIKGVRSFSPENTHVITFPKPLTLIVGRNGSGKTTIIECLKHAVTGEWPPNSHSGKSFVHDPKVYGADEVKAQIKLQCKTVTGKPFLVIRSFQLTRKRGSGKYEFKSLDQNIQIMKNNGELEGISKRCVDINQEVPLLMGVSKAILENVIFVHQDDSNWPLAEGAVLKKRFDDIFAATKYTKALEAIRKLKTEQAGKIKEMRPTLDKLKNLKDQATKLRSDLAATEGERAKHVEDLRVLQDKALEKEAELGKCQEILARLQGLHQQLSVLKARRDTVIMDNTRRKEALTKEIAGSTLEELLKLQREQQERADKDRTDYANLEHELSTGRAEWQHLSDQYNREMVSCNRLQTDADMQSKRVTERQNAVKTIAERHPAIGMHFTTQPTAADVQTFEQKATARMQALQKQLDDQLAANAESETRATQRVDVATANVTSLAESGRQKSAQLKRSEERLASIAGQLKDVRVTSRAVQEEEQALKSVEGRLEAKKAELAASTVPAQVTQSAQALEGIKAELVTLRRDRDELSTAAGEAAKVALYRTGAKDMEDSAQKAYDEHLSSLEMLFGSPAQVPGPKDLAAALATLLADLRRTGGALDTDVRRQRDACAGLDGRLSDAKAAVQRLTDTLAQKKARLVNDVLSGGALDSFMERMKGQEEQVALEAQSLANIKAWQQLFTLGVQSAAEQHKCNLCDRAFTAAEEAVFVQSCDQKVKVSLPQAAQKKEAEHRLAADALAALVQARPMWEDCKRLETVELPAATQAVTSLRAEHDAAGKELAALEQRQSAHNGRIAQATQLSGEAANMVRLWQDAAERYALADTAERSIAHLKGAGKSMEQLNTEIKAAEARLSEEEHKCQKLRERLQIMQTELLDLERGAVTCRETLHSTRAKAEKGEALEQERKDLLAQVDALKRELGAHEQKVATAEAERVTADQARDKVRQECAAAAAAAGAKLRELQRDLDVFVMHSQAIKAYTEAGKEQELQQAQQSMQAAQAKLLEHTTARQAVEARRAGLQEKIRNRDASKRDLDDNVAYLQGVQQVQQLKEDIDRKLAAGAQLGSLTGAQADVDALSAEVQSIRNKQYELRGRIETNSESAAKYGADLKVSNLKDIDERFRKDNIALRTTEMANDDLNKYYTALDKALMAFHASKMAEINKVIRELWQKTYRNPDIDHIAIVSDAESATSSGRSYNYRVVMRNREEELDMRGRCSAGQKVLACLIIRLALAETFCLNCGILALDEPTTNLDAANSASLAQALTDIMNARREQASFQLIIITHDIKFAHLIGQREHADFYWRISKDEELHSHIEREDILE